MVSFGLIELISLSQPYSVQFPEQGSELPCLLLAHHFIAKLQYMAVHDFPFAVSIISGSSDYPDMVLAPWRLQYT